MTPNPGEECQSSLPRRYAFKVLSNAVSLLSSFSISGLVPRALGIEVFGNYGFLTTVFQQVATLLDFRTSTYLFVRLSQAREEKTLLVFYARYIVALSGAFLLTTAVLTFSPVRNILLPNQATEYILLAASMMLVLWVLNVATSVMDAYGSTVALEKARIANRLVVVASIGLLYNYRALSFKTYVVCQLSLALSMLIFVIFFMSRNVCRFRRLGRLPRQAYLQYGREFFLYSYPLFGYTMLGFLSEIFDRWLLQTLAGSRAQGVYSFAFGLMSPAFMFIAAMQPLMIREMSIAAQENDRKLMGHLYERTFPLLFAITAYFSAFLIISADQVVEMFGGAEYSAAAPVLRVLMFFPLIHVFASLNISVMLGTRKTGVFLVLALVLTPIGSSCLYLLLSKSFLGLGAVGLAIKGVAAESCSVVVLCYLISRLLGIRFVLPIVQGLYIVPFLGIALSARHLADTLCSPQGRIVGFFVSGVIYSGLMLCMLAFVPFVLGVSRKSINDGWQLVQTHYGRGRERRDATN